MQFAGHFFQHQFSTQFARCLTDRIKPGLDPCEDNIVADFNQSITRDELRGERGAKQFEGTWCLLLPLSQEIVACSTEGALWATI